VATRIKNMATSGSRVIRMRTTLCQNITTLRQNISVIGNGKKVLDHHGFMILIDLECSEIQTPFY